MIKRDWTFDGVSFTWFVFKVSILSRIKMLIFNKEVDPALINDTWIIFF